MPLFLPRPQLQQSRRKRSWSKLKKKGKVRILLEWNATAAVKSLTWNQVFQLFVVMFTDVNLVELSVPVHQMGSDTL